MYQIEIKYRTGNSFGSHTETEFVGCSWEDLDEAKEALSCIKKHDAYFEEIQSFSYKRSGKRIKIPKGEYWFNNKDDYYKEHTMFVKINGEPKQISVFWRGYFETLINAKIIADESDMEFETGRY